MSNIEQHRASRKARRREQRRERRCEAAALRRERERDWRDEPGNGASTLLLWEPDYTANGAGL